MFTMRMIGASICAAALAVPSTADWLVYTDLSPGSHPFRAMLDKWATDVEETIVIRSDPNEFVKALESEWSRVFVAARHTATEPAYASALRGYVTGNRRVEMYLWHDDGTTPSSRAAVSATSALVIWQHGQTTLGYAISRGAPETATLSGLVFPGFAGVERRAPEEIVSLSAEEASGMTPAQVAGALVTLLQQVTCKDACLASWSVTVKGCGAILATQAEQCTRLYNTRPSHVDPAQYVSCVAQANTNHTNCLTSAATTYVNCVKLCDLQN